MLDKTLNKCKTAGKVVMCMDPEIQCSLTGEIGRNHPSLLGEVLIGGHGMPLSGAVSTYIVKN